MPVCVVTVVNRASTQQRGPAGPPTGLRCTMAVAPDSLPVLRRGRHRNPRRGACFMEFTSGLAGGPWSDAPGCTRAQPAGVLSHATARPAAPDRRRLTPLPGRAIGLAAPAGLDRHPRVRLTTRLHTEVAARFSAAVGFVPDRFERRLFAGDRDVDALFWWLMDHPRPLRTSAEWVDLLIARLELVHGCYEEAMDALGLPRPQEDGPEAQEPAVSSDSIAST